MSEQAGMQTQEIEPGVDVLPWLTKQASQRGFVYLLAFADDGVIWARLENGAWKTAGQVFPDAKEVRAQIQLSTLQEAHAFGPSGELRLWRVGSSWRYVWLEDAGGEDTFEERYLLWGKCDRPDNLFSLMREGEQDLLHAPPIGLAAGQRAALIVRHSLDYDRQGQAYIAYSRLVELQGV